MSGDRSGPEKPNLLGLSRAELRDFFVTLGEKPFRANQLMQWVHQRGVADFEQMTDMGKALRARLQASAEIRPPEVVSWHDAADGCRKWIIRVSGGSCVEAVYIPERSRGTLCVSSQVGCTLDCSFCSTGKQGFQRDLTAAEIIGQVWLASRSLGSFDEGAARSITNVVLMGMGEPLLNFDNVVAATDIMLDDFGYGLSKRRVTLSTAGVVPMLKRLGEVSQVSLALSLHAPNDALRDELVPLNRKYPIATVLQACRDYWAAQGDTHRVTTIEYTMIEGVNDHPNQAHELARLLRDFPCKINLIPFNPFPGSAYRRSPTVSIQVFQEILTHAGYTATVRKTRGGDMDAACGQLVGQVADRTRRSLRYQQSGAALIASSPADDVQRVNKGVQ
ncbi:MAG TPA: 23S rRNA (adenine(2503)-C(2))-methyltransferase RlmN [Pseudomonadales bacterium]|jgi:23S rRNA (adenine2503-C2)-methyltransferase